MTQPNFFYESKGDKPWHEIYEENKISRSRASRKVKEMLKDIEGNAERDMGTREDRIEQWASEDRELLELEELRTNLFLEQLEGSHDFPIKITGHRWYNYQQAIHRLFEPIAQTNMQNDTTTLLIIRDNWKNILRLTIKEKPAVQLLREAVKRGYTFSEVNISVK